MLIKLFLCLFLLNAGVQASISGGYDEPYVVGLFTEEPFYDQTKNVSATDDRQLLQISIVNRDSNQQEVNLQSFLPPTAKLVSFFISQNDFLYHGVKVKHEKAHEIMKRAVDERSNAAMFHPKSLQDYGNVPNEQSTQNMMYVNPYSSVIFNILYEEPLNDLDLKNQKFITQVRNIIDLSDTSTPDLTAYIRSPNYPSPYPNSVDITWWVRSPNRSPITFNVIDIDMEECCDRLTIYDGFSNQYPVIGDLTGNGTNINSNTFTSSSDEMYIRFTSDCSLVMRGFHGSLNFRIDSQTTVPSVESCSGTNYLYAYPYYGYYLSSPGYPHQPHPHNLNCAWRIQASSYSYVIMLEVLDLDLESCCDSVTLYDGSSSYYPTIVQLPNRYNSTSRFYSTGTYMYIRFVSDHSVNRRGFNFSYTATSAPETTPAQKFTTDSANTSNSLCTNNYRYSLSYTGSYGYIYSPNYPYTYYSNCRTTYFLDGQLYTNVVELQIRSFSLNSYDRLTVYDGSSQYYRVLRVLTGHYSNDFTIKSTGRDMFIEFVSDDRYESSGFQLRWEAVSNTMTTDSPRFEVDTTAILDNNNTCSGSEYFTAYRYNVYSLTSPGYPYYGQNLDCRYYIQAYSYSEVIRVDILNMTLEPYNDYLYLRDGSSVSSPSLATLSGTVGYSTYSSTQHFMTIRFVTNYRFTGNDIGFQLRYQTTTIQQQATTYATESTNGTDSCENTNLYVYWDQPQSFTSPGYPYPHSNNLNCNWQIQGSYSYVIQLTILDISLESCCDRVRVYDGTSSNYPLLRTFTGSDSGIVYSTGYTMLVNFDTDSSVTYKGFQAVYALIFNQNCRIANSNSTNPVPILNGTQPNSILNGTQPNHE